MMHVYIAQCFISLLRGLSLYPSMLHVLFSVAHNAVYYSWQRRSGELRWAVVFSVA